ncbi:hypothetical protein NOR_07101 [Metarhizium rileyi]|uniref:Uncharacterized protein n=1 Tax=Metarhizium rileyi (strain RCEF 4871) TaxID=1649241 RepID=A0A166Z052_METRR|nr:hypothetical protein NOR_07101 [Metarhizium rileyi RCEF 4871]
MSKEQHARVHARVHTRCGACGLLFHETDLLHSFVRRGSGFTDHGPSKFFGDHYGISCDDVRFCAFVDCLEPHSESSMVHTDCLESYISCGLGDKLCWLRAAATWRSPWCGASPLNVPPRINFDRRLADLDLTDRVTSMPQELYDMIRDFSLSTDPMPNYSLHHYDQVVAASSLFREYVREEPLNRIESWNRGEPPEVRHGPDKPFIRLSIDWRGLRSIERLAVLPPAVNLRSDYAGYVVEEAERLSNVVVKFQLDLATLSGVTGGFRVWDTPCPPPVDDNVDHDPSSMYYETCSMYYDTSSMRHLGTIGTEAGSLTGMTFFYGYGSLLAVHVHTPAQPSAKDTFLNVTPHRQDTLIWIYVPIQKGIAEFAFSKAEHIPGHYGKRQQLLLHLEDVGDVFVGPYDLRTSKFMLIKQPQTLVYRRFDVSPIYFCDAFSRTHKLKEVCPPPNRAISGPSWQDFMYFSSAHLENAVVIRVFTVPLKKLCRGLLIEYEDGIKRALGQCRLGVDPVQKYMGMSKLCFKNVKHLKRGSKRVQVEGVIVECHSENDHTHQDLGWTCCNMSGCLKLWFVDEETRIQYSDT